MFKNLKNTILKGWVGYFYWVLRTYHLRSGFPKLKILSIDDTIKEIIREKKSISRFGDGEFILMLSKRELPFQKLSEEISHRMLEVINSNSKNHMVCLTSALVNTKGFIKPSKIHWKKFINDFGKELSASITDKKKIYGNALISRFYLHKKIKNDVIYTVKNLKKIWENQDILFVEGELSRLGIGNDLFANANSVQRIICPSKNAFEKYDLIYQTVKLYGKGKLIIIALGPTATILAFDLACINLWALDLGHIDIEYSWYIEKAANRIAVRGKKSAEFNGEESYELSGEEEQVYRQSIVAEIL